MKTKDKFILRPVLVNTWETMDKIRQQYLDEMETSDSEQYVKMMKYLLTLSPFELDVFILYLEYNSTRKVAQETYFSYNYIWMMVGRITKELKNVI